MIIKDKSQQDHEQEDLFINDEEIKNVTEFV